MAGKIQIDPAHPLGSMTAGNQQFTIAADTNHQKESIHMAVNADIPVMARNGVKHIMIEYHAEPVSEIATRYPAMATATTWDERRKVLAAENERIQTMRSAIISQEVSSIDIDRATDKWNAAFDRGSKLADDHTAAARDALMHAEADLEAHELLERVYAQPPRITDDEIRIESKKYAAVMAEDKEKSSANFADLLIESRKAGITVHFTGDRASFEIRNALQKASEDVAALIQANPVHAAHWDSIRNVRGYTVPPEDLGAYNAYMSELNRLGDIETAATAASIALRKDPILEQQRVDRILAASGGEKTVIVWGSNHAGKLNDFNEMLDARLREQSATRGGPAPTPTRVLELWHSRADRDEHGHMDGPDEPDARFYIEERDVEITASGATHVEMKPAPLSSGQSLGLSEYAALMERLTGSAAAPAPPPPERKVAAVTPKPEFTP